MSTLLLTWTLLQTPTTEALQGEVREAGLKATLEKLVAFETRMSLSDAGDPKRGIGAARAWIKAELERMAADSKEKIAVAFHDWEDPSPRLQLDGKRVAQKNVYAVQRGTTRPREAVVIGAHYDSLNLRGGGPNSPAPGANDNGSGSTAVLEVFRILSKVPSERTIIYAWFASEEQGLVGALHFATWLKEQKEFDVVAMLNNDIVGGARDDDGKPLNGELLRCYSAPPVESDSRRFARLAKIVVDRSKAGLKIDLKDTLDRPRRGGDHHSFNKAGFTAIRFIEGVETDKIHHTTDDTIARVDFSFLAKSAKADIAMIHDLSNALGAPADVAIRDGKLTWTPVKDAARYVIGIRGEGNEFTKIIEVEGCTAAVESGVQACVASVSRAGHLSLFSAEIAAK